MQTHTHRIGQTNGITIGNNNSNKMFRPTRKIVYIVNSTMCSLPGHHPAIMQNAFRKIIKGIVDNKRTQRQQMTKNEYVDWKRHHRRAPFSTYTQTQSDDLQMNMQNSTEVNKAIALLDISCLKNFAVEFCCCYRCCC